MISSSNSDSEDDKLLESFTTKRLTEVRYDEALERLEHKLNLKSGALVKSDPLLEMMKEEDDEVEDMRIEPTEEQELAVTHGQSVLEEIAGDDALDQKGFEENRLEENSNDMRDFTSIGINTDFSFEHGKGGDMPVGKKHAIWINEDMNNQDMENEHIMKDGEDSVVGYYDFTGFQTPRKDSESSPRKESRGKSNQREISEWIDHPRGFQKSLKHLLQHRPSSDCEIFVEGKHVFYVHSLILSIRSSKFRNMFKNHGKRKDMSTYWNSELRTKIYRINIMEADKVSFKDFLTYIYTGTTPLTEDTIVKMIEYSKNYSMNDLYQSCIEFLTSKMKDRDLVWELLKEKALRSDPVFMGKAFRILLGDKVTNLKDISMDLMLDFLQFKSKSNLTELEAFVICYEWGKLQQPSDLKTFLDPLMKMINFHLIPLIDLVQVIKPTNVLNAETYLQALEKNIKNTFTQYRILIGKESLCLHVLKHSKKTLVANNVPIILHPCEKQENSQCWLIDQDHRIVLKYNRNFCLHVMAAKNQPLSSEPKAGEWIVLHQIDDRCLKRQQFKIQKNWITNLFNPRLKVTVKSLSQEGRVALGTTTAELEPFQTFRFVIMKSKKKSKK